MQTFFFLLSVYTLNATTHIYANIDAHFADAVYSQWIILLLYEMKIEKKKKIDNCEFARVVNASKPLVLVPKLFPFPIRWREMMVKFVLEYANGN